MHGNGEDNTIFGVLARRLSQDYTVYAIDSRDHGKSAKTESLDYQTMTEDVAAFITELKLHKPILYGFSDGGIIGLMLAGRYPDILSKLIISGANTRPNGIKSVTLTLMKIAYFCSRDQKLKLMITQPDISKEDLDKITVPVLVLAGSRDIIKPEDTKMIAENIKSSELRILEGENHAGYVINSVKLYDIIEPFLN